VIGLQASFFFDHMDSTVSVLASGYGDGVDAPALIDVSGDDLALFALVWAASGAIIGAVVSSIVYGSKQRNAWMGVLVGAILGAIGNLLFLVPLWVYVPALNPAEDEFTASPAKVPGQ